jgi:hypothetical protein
VIPISSIQSSPVALISFAYLVAAGVTAALLCRRWFYNLQASLRLAAALVLFLLVILAPMHFLGAFEIAGVISKITLSALLGAQFALLTGVAAAHVFIPPACARVPDTDRRQPGLPAYLLISTVILAGSYFVFACDQLSSFPSGSDDIIYHLPLALRFLQEGSFRISTGSWQTSMPANVETCMILFLGLGSSSLAAVVNWFSALLLGAVVYRLCIVLSGKRTVAGIVTVVVFSIPMVEYQTFTGYVDLFGTASFLAAILFFLERRAGTPLLLLSGIACGIAIGAKPVFIAYGAVYFAAAAVILCREKRPRLAEALIVAMLIPSAFWYYRSMAATGNPFYPLQLEVGGHVLLRGIPTSQITAQDYYLDFVRTKWEWFIYPWTEFKRIKGFLQLHYSQHAGVGAAFATFVPLGALYGIWSVIRRRRTGWNNYMILLALWGLMLPVWWVAFRSVPRFGLPLWILACALSAPLLEMLLTSVIFRVLLICSICATCAITTLEPAHRMLGSLKDRDFSRTRFYHYPALLDRLPAGSRVVNYTKAHENFVFAGAHLTNRIIPKFEAPAPLTREFLLRAKADYVAETFDPAEAASNPPLEGCTLVFDENRKVGDGSKSEHWRIWRVQLE